VKAWISVDMEGIAGVGAPRPTERGDSGYAAAVDLMVGEANAAIEGALAGGATEIVVNDSHGGMDNLVSAALHPAAVVVKGQKPWSMLAGADPGANLGPFDVALFVGYHARAGHPTGVLAHTYSMRPTRTRLDGRDTGEYGFNAAVLGAWGIPVGMVAGDDALAAEIEGWLPWAERVVVKRAIGGNAAASLHPERARDAVRVAAQRALERARAGELRPLRIDPPVVIEIDYARAVQADHAAIVPLVERVGDRGIRIESDDMITAYRAFLAGIRLASIVE
jgi:D-amino peptidase